MNFLLHALAIFFGYAIFAFLFLCNLWLFYLAVMNLYRAREVGSLGTWAYRFGLPIFAIGWFMDFVANIFILTFIMLEFPKEWVVTSRLERHLTSGSGKRFEIAKWICSNLLDPFDPKGCHCKKD